jgi:hypothetical protein
MTSIQICKSKRINEFCVLCNCRIYLVFWLNKNVNFFDTVSNTEKLIGREIIMKSSILQSEIKFIKSLSKVKLLINNPMFLDIFVTVFNLSIQNYPQKLTHY